MRIPHLLFSRQYIKKINDGNLYPHPPLLFMVVHTKPKNSKAKKEVFLLYIDYVQDSKGQLLVTGSVVPQLDQDDRALHLPKPQVSDKIE